MRLNRDSEESAPAEFPPDQPEADTIDNDGSTYGADEEDDELAEELEVEAEGEDAEMVGAEDTAGPSNGVTAEVVDEDDAGSEDLEAESSGSEEEDIDAEEDEGEGEVDEDIDMGDDKPSIGTSTEHQQKPIAAK